MIANGRDRDEITENLNWYREFLCAWRAARLEEFRRELSRPVLVSRTD